MFNGNGTTTIKNLHAGGRMRGREDNNRRGRKKKEQKVPLCLAVVLLNSCWELNISAKHFHVLARNIATIAYLV